MMCDCLVGICAMVKAVGVSKNSNLMESSWRLNGIYNQLLDEVEWVFLVDNH